MSQQVRASGPPIDPYGAQFSAAFGAALIADGSSDEVSVERARRAAASTGERLDLVLTKLGLVPEDKLASALARFLGIALYQPSEEPPQLPLPQAITPSFLIQNRMLPVCADDNSITFAVVDPFDTVPLDAARLAADRSVDTMLIALSDFDRAVKALYPAADAEAQRPLRPAADASEFDLQRLRESASEAPIVRLVNKIISDAVDLRASDIHIEPTANGLIVRYRVDGILRTVETISEQSRAAVISRVKIVAKLDIAERRLPQDGRIKLAIRGNEIDFRIATIPTVNGESVVLRILDRSRVKLEFDHLGFNHEQIALLQRFIAHANGIILVTGPTGSGKTTTLYAALRQINRPSVKIFTVEDPIEYQLAGISQVQVQQSIGLDFPACLRSILRQDPDMIMIGEIRDAETARIAVQASLTGHLVFSTLHTNSAAATIMRLIDMGVEHYLLGSTIRGIIGQRLVRRLCPSCARPHENASYWSDFFSARMPWLAERGGGRFLEPAGCAKCHATGFLGRLAISEMMPIDQSIQEAILQRRPAVELASAARQQGMKTIYEDGIIKAWDGLTTVEEVHRVTDDV
ncbi:MAG: type II/IV secretion system protein [Hyphomicrobiales bacterium]|nr:type II/IV secretion system protein [Hyphomicrobiales bacterium]